MLAVLFTVALGEAVTAVMVVVLLEFVIAVMFTVLVGEVVTATRAIKRLSGWLRE